MAVRLRGQLFSSLRGSNASDLVCPAPRHPSSTGRTPELSRQGCNWPRCLCAPRAVIRQSLGSQRASQGQSADGLRASLENQIELGKARATRACRPAWSSRHPQATPQRGSRLLGVTASLWRSPLACLPRPKHRRTPPRRNWWVSLAKHRKLRRGQNSTLRVWPRVRLAPACLLRRTACPRLPGLCVCRPFHCCTLQRAPQPAPRSGRVVSLTARRQTRAQSSLLLKVSPHYRDDLPVWSAARSQASEELVELPARQLRCCFWCNSSMTAAGRVNLAATRNFAPTPEPSSCQLRALCTFPRRRPGWPGVRRRCLGGARPVCVGDLAGAKSAALTRGSSWHAASGPCGCRSSGPPKAQFNQRQP